jgi:hypothetical protein
VRQTCVSFSGMKAIYRTHFELREKSPGPQLSDAVAGFIGGKTNRAISDNRSLPEAAKGLLEKALEARSGKGLPSLKAALGGDDVFQPPPRQPGLRFTREAANGFQSGNEVHEVPSRCALSRPGRRQNYLRLSNTPEPRISDLENLRHSFFEHADLVCKPFLRGKLPQPAGRFVQVFE